MSVAVIAQRVFVLLLFAGACGNERPGAPWARLMTQADRNTWGRICGDDFSSKFLGEGPSSVEIITYSNTRLFDTPTEEEAYPIAKCRLTWHPRSGRVISLDVHVLFADTPTDAQLSPYIEMIARELPPRAAEHVRASTRSDLPLLSEHEGAFSIGGGRGYNTASWWMNVSLEGAL